MLITIKCHGASFHVEWTPEPQHIVKLTNSRLTNPQEIVIGRCEHETSVASVRRSSGNLTMPPRYDMRVGGLGGISTEGWSRSSRLSRAWHWRQGSKRLAIVLSNRAFGRDCS